jgi:trans-2,3-dihydro-3-hydroxyanthranilate isomerase
MAFTLPYTVLDVFAERPLEGNPLAVFHDARSLSTAEMQALARETNLSETTFILPSDDPEQDRLHGVRVRIFTTQEELPFAGHPTLGTATWLHLHHPALRGAEALTLRLDAGLIPVRFQAPVRFQPRSNSPGVFATMQQKDPVFGDSFDPAEIAAVLGLEPADLLPGYLPQIVSTANPFCIVALRSVEVLGRLAIPQQSACLWLREHATRWFYCIAPTGALTSHAPAWRARMQWYGGEDPATGSAAGPCIAWLVQHGLAASGVDTVIEQGVEVLRPSRIVTAASIRESRVGFILVSGRTIPVADGAFFLP